MDPLTLVAALVAAVGTLLGSIVAVLNIREKVWPKPPAPHPLAPQLRDIARAIRGMGPLA